MNQTRVLVVDDNEMFRDMAEFVLTRAAYIVQTVSNASQALSTIAVFQPDLILMDIQMPEMDGIELTRKLKADPATAQTAVVAFTAYAAKGDELGLRAAGFDGYVGKPIDVMTLAAQVGFWLEAPASTRRSHFGWP